MGSSYASGILIYSPLLMHSTKLYTSQTVVRVGTLIDLWSQLGCVTLFDGPR